MKLLEATPNVVNAIKNAMNLNSSETQDLKFQQDFKFDVQEQAAFEQSYKVKAVSADLVPDFLKNKFVFQGWNTSITYPNTLIGCKETRFIGPDGTYSNYKLSPQFLWKAIPNYNASAQQYLMNDSGTLKWGVIPSATIPQITIDGSLSAFISADDHRLFWKDQNDSEASGNVKILIENASGKADFRTFAQPSAMLNGLMLWQFENKGTSGDLQVMYPPSSIATNKHYVLEGTKSSGVVWTQIGTIIPNYTAGNAIQIQSGSGLNKSIRVKYDNNTIKLNSSGALYANVTGGTASNTPLYTSKTSVTNLQTGNRYRATDPGTLFISCSVQLYDQNASYQATLNIYQNSTAIPFAFNLMNVGINYSDGGRLSNSVTIPLGANNEFYLEQIYDTQTASPNYTAYFVPYVTSGTVVDIGPNLGAL